VAGRTAGGGAGTIVLVIVVATPAMVNHQDVINYMTKVGTMIYDEGCKELTTEFGMKLSGTVVYDNHHMHTTTICKRGSPYAKLVPIPLNIVAIPARMQTGSPHMQI
jgi:hypothetical protein